MHDATCGASRAFVAIKLKQCAVIGWLCAFAVLAPAPQAVASSSDAADAAQLLPIQQVESFVLSPDRSSMLCWRSRQARVLDRRTHAVRLHVEVTSDWASREPFFGAEFSQDGTRAVLWTRSGSLTLLQLDPPRVLWQEDPSGAGSYASIRFDAQLRRAAKMFSSSVQVFDLLETGLVMVGPPISVVSNGPPAYQALSLSEAGNRVLVETQRGIECIEIDAPEGSIPAPPVGLHGADSVQLLGDGDLAVVLLRDGAFLVDLGSGEVRAHRPLPPGRWQSRHDSVAVPVLPIWEWDASLRVLDVETLDVLWEAEACRVASYDAASDVVVVIQRYAGPVTVHDARTGERLWSLERMVIDTMPAGLGRRAIVFDGAGNFLATSYDNSAVYSFDCRTGAREELPRVQHGTATRAGLLTDEALWVADSGGELRSVRLQDGTELASVTLDEALASVESIGEVLVASSVSGRTRVWRGPELEAVTEFDGGREFALAPGADRIIGCGGKLRGWVAWSIHTGEVVATGGEAMGKLIDVACDADGKVVVALDEAHNAHTWVDGESKPLDGLLSPVEEMVVDPRGRWVALGAFGNEGPGMLPLVAVYDLEEPAPPRKLKVEGSFVWFGGHIRSLAVDRSSEFLVATTGKWGTVQCWKTSDWSHSWIFDFEGGSPAPLHLKLDEPNGRLWVWGLSWYAPRALDLRTGKTVQDHGNTLMSDFSPIGEQRGVIAILNGCIVRLDHQGNELWRRIDLGPLGAVITSKSGAIRGDAAALEHVFVQVGERVVRASEVIDDK